VRLKVRYETPARRVKGERPITRAERNAQFGKPVPTYDWPIAGDYLWDYFWKMNRERQDGPEGPQPLTSSIMRNWSELRRIRLRPEEADIIQDMDAAWLAAFRAEIAVDRKHAG
jgi:hypothetical protein